MNDVCMRRHTKAIQDIIAEVCIYDPCRYWFNAANPLSFLEFVTPAFTVGIQPHIEAMSQQCFPQTVPRKAYVVSLNYVHCATVPVSRGECDCKYLRSVLSLWVCRACWRRRAKLQ